MGSACGRPDPGSELAPGPQATASEPSADAGADIDREGRDAALAALVTDAVDAIYLLDLEGRFLYANPAACALTGYEADELEDVPFHDLVSEGDRERVRWMVDSVVEREAPLTYELDLRRKDGRAVSVEVRSTRLEWDGRVVGLQGIARDVSARRARTRELERRALHDPLTDLPNRALFRDRLEQAILVERRKGVPFAVLVVDLDGFKEVNDEHGHGAGDQVLKEVAGRLRGALRASDTVARLGGDEFAVLVDDCGISGARTVAGKLLRALDPPVTTGEAVAHVGASIGIGLCPDHGDDPDGLLERADAAMYTAKRADKGVATHGVTHVDFGRRARRRPASGSGRLSGFLAGAAAALLLVAGVTTPPLQRAPRGVPDAPSAPSEGGAGETAPVERAVELLSGASSTDFERFESLGGRTLSMAPVVFRGDGDDESRFRSTGPLSRVTGGIRMLERPAAEETTPGEDDPGPPAEGDPTPGPPEDGEPSEDGPRKGHGHGPEKGRGGDRPPQGGTDDGPARPRTPRRPDSGKDENDRGGDRGRRRRVEFRTGGGEDGGSSGSHGGSSGGGGTSRGGRGHGSDGGGSDRPGGNGNGGDGNGGNNGGSNGNGDTSGEGNNGDGNNGNRGNGNGDNGRGRSSRSGRSRS